MICPYCGRDKVEDLFTDEHVMPRSLGGNLEPTNPFRCRVCRDCNSACGRWVDGRFAKSWFIHNWKTDAARATYDPSVEPIFPPSYMGTRSDWDGTMDGTICEFWLGPTGDHVYHFHEPYVEADVFVGRPPHIPATKVDPGTVFISFVGTNPVWHPIVFRGVRKTIDEQTPIHFVNGAPPGHSAPYPALVTAKQQAQYAWIKSRPKDVMSEVNVTFDMDWGERFMIKFALGLGTILLGGDFVVSEYGKLLRKGLWEKDAVARAGLDIRGTSLLGGATASLPHFAVPQCHTIVVLPVRRRLVALVNFYGHHECMFQISDDGRLWSDSDLLTGKVWVIVPAFRRFIGPVLLVDFMNDGELDRSNARQRVDAILRSGAPLPPYHLPDTESSG